MNEASTILERGVCELDPTTNIEPQIPWYHVDCDNGGRKRLISPSFKD
jgi:hypothetical protein